MGAGEPPAQAIVRELRKKSASCASDPPEFVGLFTRRVGWATNVVALYHIKGAEIAFRPNFEIREILCADPARCRPDRHRPPARADALAERRRPDTEGPRWLNSVDRVRLRRGTE